ncbi:MAG TPA: SAM-dependent chlorinase/fluorinase, partial [Pyrinomonadaceae bacterium]|nr:SAM-dependent chlorinase/fluorinase [Pyrinomonadaceae bacterium]
MIVTLLTDFGARDYFVGAMKGALLSVNPEALIVDITHEVAPHDVEEAAFTLVAAYETFPAGTVHVAVVDPGVGSARRAIAVEGAGHLFVGPDNGVFGHVYERLGRFRVFNVVERKFFREPLSDTFH